jgi:hypothetical protein
MEADKAKQAAEIGELIMLKAQVGRAVPCGLRPHRASTGVP